MKNLALMKDFNTILDSGYVLFRPVYAVTTPQCVVQWVTNLLAF